MNAKNLAKALIQRLRTELNAGLWAGLRYWFVEYNPLYFFSALSMLYGVFLVARNLGSLRTVSPETAQIMLFSVLQGYEFLLIGGALFLIQRVDAMRPGVMLILLEAVFLFDCTFRLEGLSLIGLPNSAFMLGAWLLLTVIKIGGMARTVGVSLTHWQYAAALTPAMGMVMFIAALLYPGTNKLLVLQIATWGGAAILLLRNVHQWALVQQVIDIRQAPTAWQSTAKNCVRAWWWLPMAIYFLHLWAYMVVAVTNDVIMEKGAFITQFSALFLYGILVARRSQHIGVFTIIALGSLILAPENPAAYTFAVVGMALIYRAGVRNGVPAVAALVSYAALWLFLYGQPYLQDVPAIFQDVSTISWQTGILIALVATLGLLGWFLRDPLALLMLAVGSAYGVFRVAEIAMAFLYKVIQFIDAFIRGTLYQLWVGMRQLIMSWWQWLQDAGFNVYQLFMAHMYQPIALLLRDEMAQGIAFLLLAFVIFFAAIAINWYLRVERKPTHE